MKENSLKDKIKNTVYIWDEFILFARYGLDQKFHTHHLAAVAIGIDSPFYLETDRLKQKLSGAIIRPDTYQRVNATEGAIIVLLVDPETPEYEAIASKLNTKSFIELKYSDFHHMKEQLQRIFHEPLPNEVLKIYHNIFKIIGARSTSRQKRKIDVRVLRIAKIIKTELPNTIHIRELAKEVSISGDRLIRLFKKEMGITLRKYLLWSRIKASIQYLREGHDLTYTAHEVGFSDSAHLSRTFKQNFGFPPSLFFGKKSNLEIYFYDNQFDEKMN